MTPIYDFRRQVALVTGASSGMGLATARALSFSLDVPLAGVSTLAALAAGTPEALAVIDARRGEVFVLDREPRVLRPEDVDVGGRVCVGDGAVRYRVTFEEHGAEIPPDTDPVHVPHARFHAQLAERFGPAEEVEPVYLRAPDAKPSAP